MNQFTNVLALHCHTTGINFKNDDKTEGQQVLTIAMSVLDIDSMKPVDNIFVSIAYDPEQTEWVEAYEAVHGITKEDALVGDTRTEAAAKLGGFIAKHFGISSKIPLFGFNVNNFHLPFLQSVLHGEDLFFAFDDRSVDLFPLATTMGKYTVRDTFDFLLGESGPMSSSRYINNYIRVYKMFKYLIDKGLETK